MADKIGIRTKDGQFPMSVLPMAGSLIAAAYVVFMLVIFPLYMDNGYVAIGDVKYRLFYQGTTVFLVAAAIFFPVYGIWKVWATRMGLFAMARKMLRNISVLDRWILLYTGCICISHMFSRYREFGWKGADGWWMGLETQLFMIAAYFLISRWLILRREIWYLHFWASGSVFLLGILHRFQIDPLHVYDELSPEQMQLFLSTLGQSTWYSSYVCTVFSMGVFLFYRTEGGIRQFLLGVYSMLAFATLVTQNSDSAFVALAGIFLLLGSFSVGSLQRWRSFFMVAAVMLVSFAGMGVLQRVFWLWVVPLEPLSLFFSQNGVIVAAAAFCLIVWRLTDRGITMPSGRNEGMLQWLDTGWRLLVGLCVVMAAAACLFLYLNTAGYLTEWFGYESSRPYFIFNEQWGNNRGSSWMLAWDAYTRLPLKNKLFGVGPDCFSAYIYEIPAYADYLHGIWGSMRLTNAHNEYLNALLCYGAAGTVAWGGVLVGGIRYFQELAEKNSVFMGIALCIAGYACHNIFCYQQICCTPFLFLLLGMGESMRRRGLTNP